MKNKLNYGALVSLPNQTGSQAKPRDFFCECELRDRLRDDVVQPIAIVWFPNAKISESEAQIMGLLPYQKDTRNHYKEYLLPIVPAQCSFSDAAYRVLQWFNKHSSVLSGSVSSRRDRGYDSMERL